MSGKYLDEIGLTYLWSKLRAYFQVKLVSGTNIKTVGGQSLLGSGDIQVASEGTPTPTADEVAEWDSDAHMNSEDMTSQEVDDFVDGLNVSGINAVDYIVEQGTDGIWTYRKWNSGIAECWGKYTVSVAVTTASAGYGGYRSGAVNIPSYPFVFTANPVLTAAIGTGSSGCWINNITPTSTGGTFFLSCGGSNAAANRTISLHAIGTWK